MADFSKILSLLEQERERYVSEAAQLERRLSLIHNQITTLESLISGYTLEEQMYSPQRHFPFPNSTAVLEDAPVSVDEEELDSTDYDVDDSEDSEDENPESVLLSEEQSYPSDEETAEAVEPDISDIPKLSIQRRPGSIPMNREFQEYSIQNAILILMRRRPDLHFHLDAIVRDLYGDKLTLSQLKTVRANIGKILNTGVQSGLWHQVLYAKNVYTLHYEKGVTSKQLKS
ncbi:hypothetical protein [Brasilonema sp. UFV-L1]|uniref:hypothetical protein n=1 Tax=Brasilonema sp. UFV-L1 TaxID=2234130 RepID=UPI00145F8F52|nr:hypothetical protein [Brasilonema sp. UFV-L1]NMG07705.1 hypothetical protein [Brasilonema sp. UFV-L1]